MTINENNSAYNSETDNDKTTVIFVVKVIMIKK